MRIERGRKTNNKRRAALKIKIQAVQSIESFDFFCRWCSNLEDPVPVLCCAAASLSQQDAPSGL